jgi:hypothetical protein
MRPAALPRISMRISRVTCQIFIGEINVSNNSFSANVDTHYVKYIIYVRTRQNCYTICTFPNLFEMYLFIYLLRFFLRQNCG